MVRIRYILASGAALASCSPQASHPSVDQLVERFEVDGCADVQFIKGGRNPDMGKSGALNIYIADADCIAAMHQAFELIHFRQIGDTTFEYRSDRGWADVVTLTPLDDGSGTRIDWELES